MNKDLYIIKKKYGEKMMHFARKNFATILENEGLLSKIMLEHFEPNHCLINDIYNTGVEYGFKNYIYSLVNIPLVEINTNKTAKELLKSVGYNLYEVETELQLQLFKKYYQIDEELCTFKDKRLEICYVFFAVKDNIDEIKRENFPNPIRQDEYGTSIISIQFDRGKYYTLSIKNRYNHRVNNPDATYSNNLDNIVPGLTKAFERDYGLIQRNNNTFNLENYVNINSKYYKYNYSYINTYYCTNNIIINDGKIIKYPKERYIVMDYYILDLVNKKFFLYDRNVVDSFINRFDNINSIRIDNNENKTIYIDDYVIIKLNKNNQIISYTDLKLKELDNYFFNMLSYLEIINIPNLEKINNCVLLYNNSLRKIDFPKLKTIGNDFLSENEVIEEINLPLVEKIGNDCLCTSRFITKLNLPSIKYIGEYFMMSNTALKELNIPNIKKVGECFLRDNENIDRNKINDLIKENNSIKLDNYVRKLVKIKELK